MTPVHIIGVPLDLGGGRRGVDMGPSAFRIAGLADRLAALGIPVSDKGDISVAVRETIHALHPDRRYRVSPILVGRPPSGLNPPPWWGAITTEFEPSGERRALGWGLPADGGDGVVLSGAVLASAGVMAANMHPDHAILYRAEALD